MEHYDGPAFFRKFPVKPKPGELDDSAADRAERQVRHRQRRSRPTQSVNNDIKATPVTPSAVDHQPTNASQPTKAATEQSSVAQSYRPFQVTQVPKQLHWSRRHAEARQRYQRLIDELQKSDDSFFLYGTSEATIPESPANVSGESETVGAKGSSEASAASIESADTETEGNNATTVADQVIQSVHEDGMVEHDRQESDEKDESEPEASEVEEAHSDQKSFDKSNGSQTEEEYLPVGTPKTTPIEPDSAAPDDDSVASGADSVVTDQPQPSEVAALLERATESDEDFASSLAENDQSGSDVVTVHDAETVEPSSAESSPVVSAAPIEAEETHASASYEEAEVTPEPVTPTTPKLKSRPAKSLGHSLGDIMQEEGNDQRDLALFDRPTPATAATSEQAERGYHFPDVSLLPDPVVPNEAELDEWIEHQAEVLDETLNAFHVDAHVTDWTVGPTVTQFQISLALGVKVNKITNLTDDLKLALAAKDIRIEAPIPGKSTVGIEIPNRKSRPVMLAEILNSPAFQKSESPLTVALGVDLFGQPQVTDLRKMPHGLIAGATGSGKSVFINSLLLSLLYKATPQQVKLLLIDPKAVEMAPYDGLPHLLAPVISDPKAAAAALKWVVTEMDQRYEKLAAAGVRNIEQFNDRADANDEPGLKMPYIVIIIDELADLMMMAASEVQDYIVRITQKARAAGIHLLVATQRPSVDIVTGTIKNNIPTRIAFMVSSQIDSRTILDTAGAENLLGKGDMLYLGNGASQPLRLQGAFVENEVDAVTDFVRTQGQPQYAFEPQGLLRRETAEENQDELMPRVLAYVAQEDTVSTSKLQRVFSIGYNRAANLIDDLEQHDYVSPQRGSKPREVYLKPEDLDKQLPEAHDQGAPFSS
ncbi:DNA translocase FtsK [Levilactobacillus tangyuanensis]|uniref:DNA translocase FtsK n=1 Tax=Levilactobacillus tangyuanensis TaxID=2486021 RepID=A0ABW1TQK2_9LACO|nr:DNA translocase FtsK [Levilactobacillus tangyuanensis]